MLNRNTFTEALQDVHATKVISDINSVLDSFPSDVEHLPAKHVAPPVGSSIPTLVSRGADPLNGAASKRPHSPSLEEQSKRLKETDKARIHIAWPHNWGLDTFTLRGGASQSSQTPRGWLHTGRGSTFRSLSLKDEAAGRTPHLRSWENLDLPVSRWLWRAGGHLTQQSQRYLTQN